MANKKKKVKKEKVKKTPKQKRKIALKVIIAIVVIIALLAGILAVLNVVSVKSNAAFIRDNIEAVKYEKQLNPEKDDKGRYTFVTDEDFKVLQITDVHIGGGVLSSGKDSEAINAVAAMVTTEKPDLVIVTGDVAYPVPYQSGTFNNIESAKLFASLMEKERRVYELPGGLMLEVNLVELGDEAYRYAEIEFESIDAAESFLPEGDLCKYLEKEVTSDKSYTMASKWKEHVSRQKLL